MKDAVRGDAYVAVRHIYDKSPGRNWRRLNGALQDALTSAITAHLSFLPDDFIALMRDTSGGHWMGNGYVTCGEGFYMHAVKVNHTPACIAFEKFAGRPAALWAEKVKTPERLCVGADFTWEGCAVTVTSMTPTHLVACSYKDDRGNHNEVITAGSVTWTQGRRLVEWVKHVEDGSMLLRLSANAPEQRSPDRVFKITYEALTARRKQFDMARKDVLKSIGAADTAESLHAIRIELANQPRFTYRHFDIEDFRLAIDNRKKDFDSRDIAELEAASEAERLEHWKSGKLARGWFSQVCLRVNGAYVEASTGQSVSLSSARELLPWLLLNRKKVGPVNGWQLDLHEVKRITPFGVLIGCTRVPWTEIDRVRPEIEVQA